MSQRFTSNSGLPNFPPRWKKCPRMGDLILNIFIPFKTPLDNKFTHYLSSDEIFDVDMIFSLVQPYSIGMVIDLTKSKRFYNRKEIETKHIKYVKIECKGNEETPTEEQVNLFIRIVNQFRENHPDDVLKIAVHCTHGFNRTGFLIVSYLVEECDYSVDAAVQMFADARPPGIYKQNYLDELFRRFGDIEDTPTAPDLPDWCNEEDDSVPSTKKAGSKRTLDDDPYEVNNSNNPTSERALSRVSLPPPPNGIPLFMPGVSGVETLEQNSLEAHKVRELVNKFILTGGFIFGPNGESLPANKEEEEEDEDEDEDEEKAKSNNIKQPKTYSSTDGLVPIELKIKNRNRALKFRGSQPVSMTHKNLPRIIQFNYSISYKADGTRYLILIWKKDHVYFIDRGNFVYKATCLEFPTMHWVHMRKTGGECVEYFQDDHYGHMANCLLDGELILVQDEHDSLLRSSHFLIYDVITMYGRSYGHRPFVERYNAIENHVINPRTVAINSGWLNASKQIFPVTRKKFYPIFELEKILDPNLSKKLRIELDGIIFQPSGPEDRYMLGTCPTTLKWKPPELNSVDFLCKVYRMNKTGCLPEIVADLYLGGQNTYCIRLPGRSPSDLDYDGKIVECTFDFQIKSWKFLRMRTDKTEPNHVTSGSAVVESILKPVTDRHLISAVRHLFHLHQQRQLAGTTSCSSHDQPKFQQ